MTGATLFPVLTSLMPQLVRALGEKAATVGPDVAGRELFDAGRLALPTERIALVADSLEVLAELVRGEGKNRQHANR